DTGPLGRKFRPAFDLPGPHAYAVLGFKDEGKTIVVQNPWDDDSGNLLYGSTFDMPFATFYNSFRNVCFETNEAAKEAGPKQAPARREAGACCSDPRVPRHDFRTADRSLGGGISHLRLGVRARRRDARRRRFDRGARPRGGGRLGPRKPSEQDRDF